MLLRKTRKTREARDQERKEAVRAVFALIPSDGNPCGVFEEIRAQAVARHYGWKNRLNDYLAGLRAGGAIDSDQWSSWSKRVAALPDGEYSSRDAWRVVGTTVLIALGLAVFCFFSIIQWTSAVVLYAATIPVAITLVWWSLARPLPPVHLAQPRSRIETCITLALCTAVVGLILMALPLAIWSYLVSPIVDRTYKTGLAELASARGSYSTIAALAKKTYNVDFLLADWRDGAAGTTFSLPAGSPALLELNPGSCVLQLNLAALEHAFSASGVNQSHWVEGVLVHELGHCVDESRDAPSFTNSSYSLFSFAPVDRRRVTNSQSFYSVSLNDSTQRWREAFGDLFAVGYWRLTYPAEAPNLIANLLTVRKRYAFFDRTHDTRCWIAASITAAPPTTLASLLSWSDHIRNSTSCRNHGT